MYEYFTAYLYQTTSNSGTYWRLNWCYRDIPHVLSMKEKKDALDYAEAMGFRVKELGIEYRNEDGTYNFADGV